ncbi:MAG: Transcriptional regulator, AraC family [Verrucomicrobiales bacterium]|nr:Transcriptional regulator, AraC family [Verrucomicrobiales bacterium]
MRKTHQNLSETHLVGEYTREKTVRAEHCPVLQQRQIAHLGVADAATPYSMVRTHLNGTYMLACFSGQGQILLDGRWQTCREGMACLAPPHVLHAFHAMPGHRWGFCWVKYEQPAGQKPFITSASPVMAKFDALALKSAIDGLSHESAGSADPALLRHWLDLVHLYVLRFAQPWHQDDRLSHLWAMIEKNPGDTWTLDRLASLCHYSSEHLRRLCQKQLGRSPMHHVTYLRMQKAAQLLESTSEKIEGIADAVGYENPFVFSTTFKKWIGWRPSEYRKQRSA